MGLLRVNERDEDFVATVEGVARRWLNILRFADQRQLERFLVGIGELQQKELDRGLKPYCGEYVNECFRVVKRCNQRWMKMPS